MTSEFLWMGHSFLHLFATFYSQVFLLIALSLAEVGNITFELWYPQNSHFVVKGSVYKDLELHGKLSSGKINHFP